MTFLPTMLLAPLLHGVLAVAAPPIVVEAPTTSIATVGANPCWQIKLGVRFAMSPDEQRVPVCLAIPGGVGSKNLRLQVAQQDGGNAPTRVCIEMRALETASHKEHTNQTCRSRSVSVPLSTAVDVSYRFAISTAPAAFLILEAGRIVPPAPPPPPRPPRPASPASWQRRT